LSATLLLEDGRLLSRHRGWRRGGGRRSGCPSSRLASACTRPERARTMWGPEVDRGLDRRVRRRGCASMAVLTNPPISGRRRQRSRSMLAARTVPWPQRIRANLVQSGTATITPITNRLRPWQALHRKLVLSPSLNASADSEPQRGQTTTPIADAPWREVARWSPFASSPSRPARRRSVPTLLHEYF
jgi:hypothetical protein